MIRLCGQTQRPGYDPAGFLHPVGRNIPLFGNIDQGSGIESVLLRADQKQIALDTGIIPDVRQRLRREAAGLRLVTSGISRSVIPVPWQAFRILRRFSISSAE